MALLYIKENTTVGDIKNFLANIPDDSKVFLDHNIGNIIRLDDFKADCYSDSDRHELYIELV